jgi:O-antigen ligase
VIRFWPSEAAPGRAKADFVAVGGVAVLAYFVVAGDLGWRDIHPMLRITTLVLSAVLIGAYVSRAPDRADRFDQRILVALLVFLVPCVLSRFPRQSFDAALAALLYVSALFVGRDILARESARRLFIVGLMALSVALTLLISAQLIVPFVAWWALAGGTLFPPLDLKVIPVPWASRYELALLLVMLYPSWWVGTVTRSRAIAGTAVGILVLAACVIVGSRTVWLAVFAGGVAAILPIVRAGFRWDQRRVVLLLTFSVMLVTFMLVSGLSAAFLERVARLEPLAERASTWATLIHAWADHPIVGFGPGSFPWVLQSTNYFDTNSFAPRHADGALLQLLVESGLAGLAAAVVVLTTVVPAVFQGRSRAARFALVTCLASGIGLSPSQFAFIVAMAIAWVAFGVPRETLPDSHTVGRRSMQLRTLSVAAASIVGLAFGSTMVADFAYLSARAAVDRQNFREAEASLNLATILDPGLAIYSRQLGTVRLISSDPRKAVIALERATAINPSDDLAWRILGLAYSKVGVEEDSRTAIERAIDMQRSDPTNLLLLAKLLRDEGNLPAASDVLAEIVQAWPMIVAAPGWTAFARPFSTNEILEQAHDRWSRGAASPEPLSWQSLLIGVMVGATDAELDNEPAQMTASLRAAYLAVMRCDPYAGEALSAATDADRRKPIYWALAIRQATIEGHDIRDYQILYRIMTNDPLLSTYRPRPLNPLSENGARGSDPDLWGYRRQSIDWPDTPWDLPSPLAGYAQWHRQPTPTVQAAGLARVLHACAGE